MRNFTPSGLFFIFILIISDCFASDKINNNQQTNNIPDPYQKIEALYFDPHLNIDIKILEKNLPTIGSKLTKSDKLKNRAYKACLSLQKHSSLNLKPEDCFKYIQEYAIKLGKEKIDPFITYVLASLYENGVGIKKNLEKAANLYELAHKFGTTRAQEAQGRVLNLLGVAHILGKEIEKDEKKAVYLFQAALNLGNLTAAYNLGRCYEDGKGVEQNFLMAFNHYKMVSTSTNSKMLEACFKLAEFYRDGKGIEKDSIQAINFYTHIDTLLDEKQIEQKRDCHFNLGQLYHQENPYDIKLLEKALKHYEKARFLNHPTVVQHLETCKKDLLVYKELEEEILEKFGSMEEKNKKFLLAKASKFFFENMDKNDKINIFKILFELKDTDKIEKFVTCLKKIFDHDSFPKAQTGFVKIKMIQEFSLVNCDTLEIILKNSPLLFTPNMKWQEALDIIEKINKIKNLQHIESVLSICPDLFIKIKITSSQDDEENKTVKVLNKIRDMDGYERSQILEALGKVKTENLPMAFLCATSILNAETKPIDIINAIDSVRENLQSQKDENNEFEIIEKDEGSNQNVIIPIDINKIPIIRLFFAKIFNGTETIEQKIQLLNEIGKVELYKVEKHMENYLKLSLKTMPIPERIAIFQSLQGDNQEDSEKIIPYTLKIIKNDTNGYIIAKIFNIFKEAGDINKIEFLYSSFEKSQLNLSDDQKPIMLKILAQLPDNEKENFVYFSQHLAGKGMNTKETEEILQKFKMLVEYKRKSIALLFKEKKVNFEEKLCGLEEFHKFDCPEEKFSTILMCACVFASKIETNNFSEYLEYLIPICKKLNEINDKKVIMAISECAHKFNKNNIEDLISLLHYLKKLDPEKLIYFAKLPSKNAFIQDSLNTIEKGLWSFNELENSQLEKILPYVSKLVTQTTTWEEVVHLLRTFDNLSLKGFDLKDIFSFISLKKSKPHLSASPIFQVLECIENPQILKGVLKNKSCLELIDAKMDTQQITDIFKMACEMQETDLQRVVPYIPLFINEKTSNEQISELLKKLISIDTAKLQTIVFHVFVQSGEKIIIEEICKSIEKISQDLAKNPEFIVKEIIPVEDFVIYAKFASKIFSTHNNYWNIRNKDNILKELLKAKNPDRFKTLLQEYPEHLEKIFKKNERWFDLDSNNDDWRIKDYLLRPLFHNCPLETLKIVLPKTLEFITDDMDEKNIMWVFNDMKYSLSIGEEYHEKIMLETNKFITKDMNGKNKQDVLYAIVRGLDNNNYWKLKQYNKEPQKYSTIKAKKWEEGRKKDVENFDLFLQTVAQFINEDMSGENRCKILETIFEKKYAITKINKYALFIKELLSKGKNDYYIAGIIDNCLKFEEDTLKLVCPYILKISELETKFYEKNKSKYKKYDHEIKEKLEIFSKIPPQNLEQNLEKIYDSVLKMDKVRNEIEDFDSFTATCTSTLNPILEILVNIDTSLHDKIIPYTLESERIYQKYHKGHGNSSMGDTLRILGKVSPDRLDKVFSYGKEYIKIKPSNFFTDYGYSKISDVFKVFGEIKEGDSLQPIHNFVQLCMHDKMTRGEVLSIVRCLRTKILTMTETPSQSFIKDLKENNHHVSSFLYLFNPCRSHHDDTMYFDEIIPYALELRKFSIGHENYNSFEKESLFFNGKLLENINRKMDCEKWRYKECYEDNKTIMQIFCSNMEKIKEINGSCLIGILNAINNFYYIGCNIPIVEEIKRNNNSIQKAFDFIIEEIFSKSKELVKSEYAFFRNKAFYKNDAKKDEEHRWGINDRDYYQEWKKGEIYESCLIFEEILKKVSQPNKETNEDIIN